MAKKQTKKQQAMMQSDNIEMEGFSEGITYGGDFDSAFSYSFGDLGQLDLHLLKVLQDYPILFRRVCVCNEEVRSSSSCKERAVHL